ncbi:prepilin-type N-terminal cleavage/methylation domain-containing protein [Candidatus Daviesbacteria bacterium]|nr:prepilin-type N-terminal cleavage/methylation domain-containing protein [Candidatus Daviesbacteria bacterium]
MPRSKPKVSGFTLIELLVVITIIAVLAAIGLLSYSKFIETSRNAKRQSDLKLIQSALEQYHADQKFYPNEGLNLGSGTTLTNCTGNATGCSVSKTYLNSIPKDPKASPAYCYRSMISSSRTGDNCSSGWYDDSGHEKCQYYRICATLENPSSSTSCDCGGGKTGNFEVNPP